LNERIEATITLLDIKGAVMYQLQKEFVAGVNTIPLNIAQLSSGIYFVQFKSNEITKTERVSVIR
jgi:hypothetical protein